MNIAVHVYAKIHNNKYNSTVKTVLCT